MPRKYSIRKYKPRNRKLRVTKSINSKTYLIFFSFVIFSFFSIFITKNLSKIKLSKSTFFSNIIQSVSVSAGDSNVENEIIKILTEYKNSIFSENIKKEITSKLSQDFPYLSNFEINFNPITGRLKLNSQIKKSIGIIDKGDFKMYLLEDGKFSKTSYNNDSDLIEIVSDNQKEIDSKKIATIKDLYLNKEKLGFDFKVKIENNELYVINDNYDIIWGDYSYFNEKIEKISYVLKDAKSKIDEPISIDLRFFDDGKIIVSPKKTNLLK